MSPSRFGLMRTAMLTCVTLIGAGLSANEARAEDWSVGAGYGESKLGDARSVLLGTRFDGTSNGLKLYGDYAFFKYLAVQLAYADLGTFNGATGSTVNDDWQATALTLSLLGRFSFTDNFSVFGKAGYTRWSVDDEYRNGATSGSVSATGNDLSYGLGLNYNFVGGFGMRVEYERFTGLGDDQTNIEAGADVNFLSVSAVANF